MALYFKDRIPDQFHGENARYYDAVGNNGAAKLSDFKLVMKNNIPADRTGTPLSAGNLNFASGNIALPAGLPAETRRGNVISLSGDKAVPAKTKRTVAAQGLPASTAQFYYGFIRLSDTKLLIQYADRIAVATVNFNNKTVSFGSYLTPNSNIQLNTGCVLRNYDESSTALIAYSYYAATSPMPMIAKITGDVISANVYGTALNGMSSMTNPVRVSNSSVLVCAKNGNDCCAAIYSINADSTAFTLTSSINIPGFSGVTLANDKLFSYDKGKGKCLLIYTQSSNVYAIPITVNGANITAGSAQLLGTTSDTLYNLAPSAGGSDRFSDNDGKIILSSPVSVSNGGAAQIQVLSVNSSGIVSKGAIQNLPIANIGFATSCMTYKNNKIYLTGVDNTFGSPYDGCLLEMTVNGTNIDVNKFRPFMSLKISNTFNLKNAAFENPNNPGQFLFMQSFNADPLPNLSFWFGYKYDCADPVNIAGIALEDPADGYVRVQTTGKNIPGIFSGLKAGQLYAAGENGSLAAVSGASDTNPIGIAVNSTDLLFFGARGL